jgi:DNA-binding MarR family transcriptional regulator
MPTKVFPFVLRDRPIPSRRHLQLLALLVVHGSLRLSDAARLMCLSQSFTSTLASHLVQLGYAERVRREMGDHREVYLFPTDTGRGVDATMRRRIQCASAKEPLNNPALC